MIETNPNVKFKELLCDLERLRNSPKPEPVKISGFLSKGGLKVLLAKSKPISPRKRKVAVALKRSGITQPVKQPKSIMVILKKPEPLAKAVPATPPHFVWTGLSGKVKLPAGSHIEGWS